MFDKLSDSEVEALRRVNKAALDHLDAIIATLNAPGIVPMLRAIRQAAEWREKSKKGK